MMRKRLKWIGIGLAVLFAGAQLIRPERTNPTADPANELTNKMQVPADVADMLHLACGDCHSNRTVWPWYAKVAPVSWWLASHVNQGRRELNLSDWSYSDDKTRRKLEAIADQVKSHDMPPGYYKPMHAQSRLTDEQRQAIIDWANAELTRRGGPLPHNKKPHQ